MPSKSAAQHRLMAMVANDPAAAKRLGIPQSVGSEFMKADKGRKFAGGGMAKKLFGGKETYAEELKEAKAIKSGKISPQQYARGERSEGVHGMKKMASGGITKAKMGKVTAGGTRPHGEHSVQTKASHKSPYHIICGNGHHMCKLCNNMCLADSFASTAQGMNS